MNSLPALPALSDAAIRECAYYLWLERGRPPHRDQEIWFAAEARLRDQAQSPLPPPCPDHAPRAAPPPAAPADLRDRRRDIARTAAAQRRRAHQLPRTRSRNLPRKAPNSPARAGRPTHETQVL